MANRFNISNFEKMYGLTMLNSTALDSFNKSQKRMNKLLNSSVFMSMQNENNKLKKLLSHSSNRVLIEQQEKFNSMFNSSVFDTMRKQQIQMKNLIPRSVLSKIYDDNFKVSKLIGSSYATSLLKQEKILKNQLGFSVLNSMKMSSTILFNLSNIKSIAESFNQHSVQHDLLKSINNSFYFNLVQELKQDNITLEETIEVVEASFSRKLEITPHTFISYEGMVQLLFAIIFLIYTQMSALESEERININIEGLEERVMAQLEKVMPVNEEVVYYVVKRTVNLRAHKNTKSSVISILFPNQHVELIKRDSKWIYIKYFDYIDCVEKMGWVYKKYLKLNK